jgi:hypothetical protein
VGSAPQARSLTTGAWLLPSTFILPEECTPREAALVVRLTRLGRLRQVDMLTLGCSGAFGTQPLAAGRYVLRLLLGACSAAEVIACALLFEPLSSGPQRTLGALATVLVAESAHHFEAAATRQLPPVMRRFTAPATLGVKLIRVGERLPQFRGV